MSPDTALLDCWERQAGRGTSSEDRQSRGSGQPGVTGGAALLVSLNAGSAECPSVEEVFKGKRHQAECSLLEQL